jgi:indolepyruvate ferredoxin oxidoreductase alpha subunit
VTRFVVDCETLLRIAAGEIEVAAEHKLVAPTLVRSQALSALDEAARRNEISAAEGIERVTRINWLKVRFLGDKVLQRTAWKVADHLGWETTFDAEFVALTQLQADAFITSDSGLARAVSGLVKTATIDGAAHGLNGGRRHETPRLGQRAGMSLEMISEKIQRSSCRPGPTRVSPVTLRSEFEHRGIVRGALLFLPASDALAMVKGARELGVPIYGVDGFWITDDTTQPDLGHSIDLGSGVGTS